MESKIDMEVLDALKELEHNASMAAHFVPHILLIGAINHAREIIAKAENKPNPELIIPRSDIDTGGLN